MSMVKAIQAKDIPDLTVLTAVASGGLGDAFNQLCEKYPFKVVCAKYEKLCSRGMMEFGTSLKYCWLTERGQEAVKGYRAR